MGKDLQKKSYFADEGRFADLINGVVGLGKGIVAPEDLTDMDSQTGFFKLLSSAGSRKKESKQRYKDLVKKAAFGVNFIVIGIENQEEVHYLMPLRCMSYDTGEYERQAAKIGKQVRKQKGITKAEFLSGFTRESKLKPCITLVVYYGENWDGAKDLYGILDFTDIPQEMHGLINNYSIYVCEVRKLEDTSMFRTDLKQVFDCIRFSSSPEKLYELVMSDPAYQELEEDAYDVIAEYVSVDGLVEMKEFKQEGRKVNMKVTMEEFFKDVIDEKVKLIVEEKVKEKTEEMVEEKVREGIKVLIETSMECGSTKDETLNRVVRKMRIPQEKAETYMEMYWR